MTDADKIREAWSKCSRFRGVTWPIDIPIGSPPSKNFQTVEFRQVDGRVIGRLCDTEIVVASTFV